MFNKVGSNPHRNSTEPMKATTKQIALLKKLHPYYQGVDISALDIKHASKMISILLTMRKNCWNLKLCAVLSDEFYDIEEKVFGDYLTPDDIEKNLTELSELHRARSTSLTFCRWARVLPPIETEAERFHQWGTPSSYYAQFLLAL